MHWKCSKNKVHKHAKQNKNKNKYSNKVYLTVVFLILSFFSSQTSNQIENSPIFCQESGKIKISNQVYLANCFFFCCRECNRAFYYCVRTVPKDYCLKVASDCGGKCAKNSSLNIMVKGI